VQFTRLNRRQRASARRYDKQTSWGRLDSTGLKGYELQVEVVWNLVKHRAKQTNANNNVVAGPWGAQKALAA